MRSFGFRLTFLVAILWAGIGSTVWALGHHGDAIETVYVMPSSVTLPVPTSYVISTSWAEPTAYAVPTYYTTAYWMDPVVLAQPTYTPTAYVRRGGLFGRRRVVERPVLASYTTPYVPTAYYATPAYRATSYPSTGTVIVPSAYVASADCVCPQVVASAAPSYPSSSSRGSGAAGSGTSTRPRVRQSEPEDRSSMRSDVGPPPEELDAVGSAAATGAPNTNAQETAPARLPDLPASVRDTSPPPPAAVRGPASAIRPGTNPPGQTNPSAANPQTGQSGTTQSAGGGAAQPGDAVQPGGAANLPRGGTNPRSSGANTGAGGNTGGGNPGATGSGTGGNTGPGNETGTVPAPTAPTAPGDSDPNGPPSLGASGEVRHESMRPSNYGTQAVRSSLRNVLVGTVLSNFDREPEEGVRISVRNTATGSGKDTTTNAFGRFAVRLADGDWAVDVTTRSGRVYEVSQIRVSNGLITDNQGRRVPSLEITR
jgi:hypothetical protein